MGKGFYRKLALNNLKRNQKRLIPYFIAAALMISIYFMVNMIIYSPGITNVPEHKDLKFLFKLGLYILNVFIAIFMLYINSFLIKQRKKELGLYGILGLEKRHVGRILLWENILLHGSAILTGIITGCVFGWMIFMLLMKTVKVSLDSYFMIPPKAIIFTIVYFSIIYFLISLLNLLQIRMANPIDLLKSDHQGEKKSRFLIPVTIFGVAALAFAYYTALKVTNPIMALKQFFGAIILVIAATYALFTSGSIFLLKLLKRNKKYYYKTANFVSVAGMLHRMKQNAAGLASICILSTMVLFTVSTCIALYFGQEDILAARYQNDITMMVPVSMDKGQQSELEEMLNKAAEKNHVEIENLYYYKSKDFVMAYKDGKFIKEKKELENSDYSGVELVDVSIIALSDYNRICSVQEELKDDELIMLTGKEYNDLNELTESNSKSTITYKITKHLSDTRFTKGENQNGFDKIFFVIKDLDSVAKGKHENYSEAGKYIINLKGSKENGYTYSQQINGKASKIVDQCSIDSVYLMRAQQLKNPYKC